MKYVAVFGDAMIDEYIYGSVKRVSPEAPIPIVSVDFNEFRLGGACNVANNLAALGCAVYGIFLTGSGKEGNLLKEKLADSRIHQDYIVSEEGVHTIRKTRIIGNNQQIVRLDCNDYYNMSENASKLFKQRIDSAVQVADIFIISDYNKGVCSAELCQYIINACKGQGIPVIIDPKGTDWEKYKGASVITPNMKEINEYSRLNVQNADDVIERAFSGIHKKIGVDYVLLTRSERGMSLIGDEGIHHLKASQHKVFDVSGAGDTAVAALAFYCRRDMSNITYAVHVANIAAGLSVLKSGTSVVTQNELSTALDFKNHSKMTVFLANDYSKLLSLVEFRKSKGESIAMTNGCFDIVHPGHARLIQQAASFADHLIVGINSDQSVRRLKGSGRPINSEENRAYVVAGMKGVDAVVIFDPAFQQIPKEDMMSLPEDIRKIALEAPMGIMRLIRPDIHVKGGDYKREMVPEAMYADKYISVPFYEGYSTSNIVEKIRK